MSRINLREVAVVRDFGAPFFKVCDRRALIPREGLPIPDVGRGLFRIVFVYEGSAKREVDGKVILIKPGDIMVFGGEAHHRWLPWKDGPDLIQIRYLSIFFQEKYPLAARRALRRGAWGNLMDRFAAAFRGFRHIPAGQTTDVRELVHMTCNECISETADQAERMHAFCDLLATATLRSVMVGDELHKKPETPARLHVRKARELIWTEFSNPGLTLDKVAWRSGLSAQHLERCFRAEMGITVFDYLRHVRIEQAKLLLMDTSLAVGVIAERVGFSSHALFSRNFRRAAGIDARAFRCHLADVPTEEGL